MISERVIQKAVKEYEVALRIMSRDNMPIHAFDIAVDSAGELQSCLIVLGPKPTIHKALHQMAKAAGTFVTEPVPLGSSAQ